MAWSSTEQAYWDGFQHSMTFGVIDEDFHGRDYGTPSDNPDSAAYWMGVSAGTIAFSGGYAAVQMSPWIAGTAAAEGTFFSHLGIIGMEMGLGAVVPLAVAVGTVAAAGYVYNEYLKQDPTIVAPEGYLYWSLAERTAWRAANPS